LQALFAVSKRSPGIIKMSDLKLPRLKFTST
jgi:hypothetical protein